jgi:hypothetical protein
VPTTQELIDQLPTAASITPGVTTGHVTHSGIYKQIFQQLLTALSSAGTDPHPHAVESPDDSVVDLVALDQATYDGLGPGRPATTLYVVPIEE